MHQEHRCRGRQPQRREWPDVSSSEAIRLALEQFEPAADLLGRAFVDYPLMQYAVPDMARRPRAARALYASVLWYTLRYGESYTTAGLEGVAGWLPPAAPFPRFWRMLRSGMLVLPVRFGWSGFGRLQAADVVAEERHRAHAPGPHWYLWAIGVDPPHQRRGIAGRLMRPVLDRADQAGLPCYLETHRDSNVRVYERSGFQVVSQSPVPGHPLTVWAMLRRPGGATAD
jgi:ribosomal protein S18 acetylase RimI-like enzyme